MQQIQAMLLHDFLKAQPTVMIVCVCNNVSDKTIRQAVANGAESLEEIRAQLNVGSCCGKCVPCAETLFRACLEDAGASFTELRRAAVAA